MSTNTTDNPGVPHRSDDLGLSSRPGDAPASSSAPLGDQGRQPLAVASLYWALALTVILLMGRTLPSIKFFSVPEHYLPFHTTLEFFAIAVSFLVAAMVWNLRVERPNSHQAILGAGFVAVVLIDLAHTLSYPGMPLFVTPNGPEKAINFWLSGRSVAALAMLAVALIPSRHTTPRIVSSAMMAGVVVAILTLWTGLFHMDWLPRTFIPGKGLTSFKIGFEYGLGFVYAVAAAILTVQCWRARDSDRLWFASAAWIQALAEMFFTLYADVTDIFNMLGHVYKVIAYVMIYRALYVSSVQLPYRQLQHHRDHLEEEIAKRTQALRHQQVFAEAVLENIEDGIVACDTQGRLTLLNRAAREMRGLELNEPIPLDPMQLSGRYRFFQSEGTNPLERTAIPVYRALRGERFRQEEVILERTDGRRLTLLASGQPMHDQEGRQIGAVSSLHDITDAKAIQKELVQAKESAIAANEAKSAFLANMSHELRTPIGAVLGMLYLALRRDPPEALRNYLSKAQTAAHSLLSLINDILDLSKIEAGKLDIEHVDFQFDSVLERLADVILPEASRKGLEFNIKSDPDLPRTLTGDPLRLGQILLNLCNNAVKFTEHGNIELMVEGLGRNESGITIRICVRDSGIGMSPEQQTRLFQKFSQADQSTTRRFGGTGLGLSISRHLVEMMGGRIWIDASLPGEGTTICFTLPLGVPRQLAADTDMGDRKQLTDVLLAGKRVLVVEDNEVTRETLHGMLDGFHMYVETVADGQTAFEALRKPHSFDLVLLDWRLPDMDGGAVIRRLRESAGAPLGVKIVVITAYGREDVFEYAKNLGVDGFLIKPVLPSHLVDTLLSVFGAPKTNLGQEPFTEPASEEPAHDFRGMKLLLVEDNEINREFASEFLRSVGFEVVEAVDGKAALQELQHEQYDGVLMDIHMPVMDGLEATRRIRALASAPGGERYARLPIIAMTAMAMQKDVDQSLTAGMNDHVSKPINPEGLLNALSKWIIPATMKSPAAAAPRVDLPPDLQALTSLDARQGVFRIGGNVDAYRRQLLRFRDNYAQAGEIVTRLVEQAELSQAGSYCHALKGVTGNIGAVSLHALVTQIDDLLKGNRHPAKAQLDEMAASLGAVVRDIETLASLNISNSTAVAWPGGNTELLSDLRLLQNALVTDLGAAEPLLNRLRSPMAATPWAQRFAQIDRLIDTFDVGAASSRLADLLKEIEAV